MVLNQAQKFRLKNSSYILEWLKIKLWSTGRYASYSELTKHKLKDRISRRNWNTWFEKRKTSHCLTASANR